MSKKAKVSEMKVGTGAGAGDSDVSSKRGRPSGKLVDRDPAAYALLKKLFGTIDTVRYALKDSVSTPVMDSTIMNALKEAVKTENVETRLVLHQYLRSTRAKLFNTQEC